MDKKKKALLITAGIAAVLLAAALFLSRPQPLGELLRWAAFPRTAASVCRPRRSAGSVRKTTMFPSGSAQMAATMISISLQTVPFSMTTHRAALPTFLTATPRTLSARS